jgi:hypothetical protein
METLEQRLQLKCYRCGHEWLRRTVNSLPKQCPLCHSALWNENILGTDKAKAIIKEKTRAMQPELTNEEFERFFNKTYAGVVAAFMSDRNLTVRADKAAKKAAAKGKK